MSDYSFLHLQESLEESLISGIPKSTSQFSHDVYFSSTNTDMEEDFETKYYTCHGLSILPDLTLHKSIPNGDLGTFCINTSLPDLLSPILQNQSTPLKTKSEEQISRTSSGLLKVLKKQNLSFEEHNYHNVVAEMAVLFDDGRNKDRNFLEDLSNSTEKEALDLSLDGESVTRNRIYILENIIGQTKKFLNYGQRRRNFVGTYMHLDAERILLLSNFRRQELISHLSRTHDMSTESTARVTIDNVTCVVNSDLPRPSGQDYYICVLQHKTTVHITRLGTPNQVGAVLLGGSFKFDNMSSTFNIKIQLYRVHIPKRSLTYFALNFIKKPKLPMMQLVGETSIGMLNIHNKNFTFKNMDQSSTEHTLVASIKATLNLPSTIRGFLLVCEADHPPQWTRRWCVLQDTQIMYYGSDEELEVIDLQYCKHFHGADNDIYPLGRETLCLSMNRQAEFKRFYISSDSPVELDVWRRNIEVTLELIERWMKRKSC